MVDFATGEPHSGVWSRMLHIRGPVASFESKRCVKARRMSVRQDYLTVGVAARRKWFGLEGRGGLTPRGGVCAGVVAFSALKVFIS